MNIPFLDLKAQYQTIREQVLSSIEQVLEDSHVTARSKSSSEPFEMVRTLSWIWKGIIGLINLPIWLLAKLVPKSKHVWVFGSWAGSSYSDNPKWLFEYVNASVPNIRAIWLSRDKRLVRLLRERGLESYYSYSIKGYWYSARAFVGIVCIAITDINRFVTPPFLVNTWHGTPIKKVLNDDKKRQVTYAKSKIEKLLPFFENLNRYNLVTAESEIEAEILKRSFSSAVVEVTGEPRNDVLVKSETSGEAAQVQEGSYALKRILYLPTHRMYGKNRTFSQLAAEFANLDPVLRHLNALLLIKLHYYHQDEAKELAQKLSGLKNVRVLLNEELGGDVYPLLASCDILITDYSSVYVDFLLTEKPIIFYCFDLQTYMAVDREFNFDYNEVTPGPKCFNLDEVAHWIQRFLEDDSPYKKERKELKDKFHRWDDGLNSKRVSETIMRMTEEST